MTRSDHRAWLEFSRPWTWLAAFLFAVAGVWSASLPSRAQNGTADHYLTFSGDGQYVFVPHGPELNSFPFTIAFWLKTTQTNDFVGVATKYLTGSGNGWDVHLSNGYLRSYYFKSWSDRLWTGDGAFDRPNGGFVADGRWHHIAYTVDETGGRFYVDGEMTDHLPWTGIAGAPTHPMELILGGTRVDKTTDIDGHFVGSLDAVRIWNWALDGIGVRQLMAGAYTSQDPVLHFDFDQEVGPVLTNRAATGARFQGEIRGPVPPVFMITQGEERPTPTRKRLVQRMFIPLGSGGIGQPWGPKFDVAEDFEVEAPEVMRVPQVDGSIIFLDSEGQPIETLGNGTGRLSPGSNGISERILRVFPDGMYFGQSELADGNMRIQRFHPDGSPDSSFLRIEFDSQAPARVLRSGAVWLESSSLGWRFYDRNGVPAAGTPDFSSYRPVGSDASGRAYFSFNSQPGPWDELNPPPPFGFLVRCLPDGRLDPSYRPLANPGPTTIAFDFGPVRPSGEFIVGVTTRDDRTGDTAANVLEISEDGQSLQPIASTAPEGFRMAFLASGDLAIARMWCERLPWGSIVCGTGYYSLLTGTAIPAPALLPRAASEVAGPVWATGIRSRDEFLGNPEARPPSPALQTLSPPWYRELRTSPAPEAGFSDTGLFLPESELSVPVLRAGSTVAPATVRGRLFPRTRNGWNEAEALPFEATFPVGAAETTVNVSFLAREGAQPLREFLLRLESGTGIDISPFRACRIWVLDDQQLPAPGELRLVTGVGRDEEGTAYLIGNLLPGGGQGPRSAPSLTSTAWNVPEGAGANVLEKLLSQSSAPGVWILPIQTTGQAGFFRP